MSDGNGADDQLGTPQSQDQSQETGRPAERPAKAENGQQGGSSMLSVHLFHRIRGLREEGKSKSAIARELGIDRKTVRKYMETNSPPRYQARDASTKPDPFAPFADQAMKWLEHNPRLTAREVFEYLREEGYRGSERTVNRRLARVRGERPKERYFEQEYLPGKQSQFDFKESVELPFVDGPKVTHLHFGTLPFSDFFFVRGYPFKTYECFADGFHSFFERIGGMTPEFRMDNLSPCVKKVLKAGDRIYTAAFERAIRHYDFKVLPCTPRKGNEKGDVERDIRSFAQRIKNRIQHEGVTFRDWNHLNQWLAHYCETWLQDEDRAGVREKLKLEQAQLLPLPRRDEDVLCRVESAPSTAFGTVRINGSTYSVPDEAISIGCRTVMGPFEVKVFRADASRKCIATHPALADGESSILLSHVLPSLIRKPQAMVRWAHKEILFPKAEPAFRRYYARLRRTIGLNAEREFLRAINLVHYVALSEIGAAMALILETRAEGEELFEALRELLLGARRPEASVIEISSRFGQRPLEPKLSEYDELIPKSNVTNPGLKGGPPDDDDNDNNSDGDDGKPDDENPRPRTDARPPDQSVEEASSSRSLKAVR